MGSNFNTTILVDKLAKLNSSQQSIETLSHWCIFHMNKAKLVVKTWGREFHRSPREQRLAFLYLANDIIQNSRRKGIDFVTEFWKVLPESLRDVIGNGDEVSRNAAFRLINIWDERQVFGSRGQSLKEEFIKRRLEDENRSLNLVGYNQRQPSGSTLNKLISGYEVVNGLEKEEDEIYCKCKNAIIFVDSVDKDIKAVHGKGTATEELKRQNSILRGCVEKLTAFESSRASLVALLRESLRVEEDKLDQIRHRLQVAQTHSDQADIICRQLLSGSEDEQIQTEPSKIEKPPTQGSIEDQSNEYSSEKKARINNDHPYIPQYTVFTHPEQMGHNLPPPPPLPPLPPLPPSPLLPLQPPMQVYPPSQYIHTSLPIPNKPHNK